MGLYGSPNLEEKRYKPKKPFYKRWWFIAIVVIFIVASLGGGEDTPKVADNEPSVQSETTEQVNSEPKEPEEVQEFFKLGEVVETKKVNATITNVEKSNGSEYNKPADGNEFVLINLEMENISDSELNISSILSFSSYVDDVTINESLTAQISKEGSTTVDGTIAAGKKLKGTLGYEVPKGWKQIEVHFEPNVWDSTVIKWLIEN